MDIQPTDLSPLDQPCDVIFPVLHGEWGEDGTLQLELETRGLKFVGSGSAASRLGMNKVETKKVWEKAGLPTPPYRVVTSINEPIPQEACVVKAIDSGSSVDVYVCRGAAEGHAHAADAVAKVLAKHPAALIEKFISGPELTVGLFEEKSLAPIRIVPKVEFFDYEAKYKRSDTEHRFDTGLPAALIAECKTLAEKANSIVGARDLARVDIMIDETTSRPYLLEINTLPGFTSKSLLPEAAGHAGIPFAQLVDRLVKRAAAR